MRYIGLILLFVCAIAQAEIYMKKDQYGNITYSDKPLANGTKIEIPNVVNTTPSVTTSVTTTTTAPVAGEFPEGTVVIEGATPPVPGAAAIVAPGTPVTAPAVVTKKNYTTFAIASPHDQETIQNQPIIPVEVVVDPPLQKGDQVVLLLDGKPNGAPQKSTRLQLENVERGSHQVAAILIDPTQKILKQSSTITIFVHRASIQTPPAAEVQPNQPNLFQRIVNRIFPIARN